MANTTSTTSFRADISQLKSAMQQVQKQVNLANSEFKKATAGMDNWSQSATGLQAKLKQLDSVLTAQKQKLNLLKEEYEKTTAVYGENSAAALRVKTAMNNQEAAIAKTEKEIGEYSEELKKAEKYGDNFSDSLDDMNDAADQASDGFTVMKGALASLIADGIRMAISALKDLAKQTIATGMAFEGGMASVSAISGATAEEVELLTEKAKEMGATTKFSATQSAEAFTYMAMAGWKTEDMLEGIEGIMNLAAASGSDLATTSDIVTDALTAMGYSAGDAGRLADVMAAASSNANTNVELMGETFKYAAPLAGAMGYTMEDVAVAIGLMANAGIKGSQAGTSLRSMFSRLAAPPKECATAMEELGISLTDSNGQMKSLDEVIRDLREAFSGLSEVEQTTYAKHIAGQQAMSGLLAIVNSAPADFEKLTEAVQNSGGAAQGMADIMNDTVQGQLTLLKSQVEGIQIQIYEKLEPALRDGLKAISETLSGINWDKASVEIGKITKKAVDFAVKVITNFEGIVDMLKAVGTTLAVTFTISKIAAFGKTILLLTKQIKAFKAATDLATASQKLFNIAQAAAPIGILIAAVAGLTAGLIYLAGKNKEAAEETQVLTDEQYEQVDAIHKTTNAYNELKSRRDENVSAIESEYEHYGDLVDELDSLVDANGFVKAGYEDRVNFILTTLNDALGTEMQLVDGVIANYHEERQAIEDLIEAKKAQAILSANEEAYTDAIQNQKRVLGELVKIENEYKDALDASKKATAERTRIQNMSADEYAKSLGIMTDAGMANEMYQEKLAETIAVEKQQKAAVGDLRVALGEAEQNYANYNATIENYEGLASAIISKDADKIHEALQNEINDFISAESGTEESLQRQVYTMQANYEELKKAVENGSSEVTQEMVNDAKAMVDSANSELDKFKSKANKSGSEGTSNYVKGMNSNSTAMIQAAKGLRDNAEAAFKPSGATERSGEQVDEGYAQGMYNNMGAATTAADTVAEESIDTFDDTLGVESPSRRTFQSGVYFAQGFINGMSSLQTAVYNKAYNLARSAVDAVKKAQKEGSPSKLTYQSGQYFTQGYINGIASENKALQNTVKDLVKNAYKTLSKMSRYNFDLYGETAISKFSKGMQEKLQYALDKMQYQNEKKLEEFDDEIQRLQKQLSSETSKINEEGNLKKEKLQEESDKRLEILQEKYNNEEDKERKKAIKNQIDAEKKYTKELIKVEENATKKLVQESQDRYDALIKTQNDYKEAYSKASSKMISEYSKAMGEYQDKAQTLIDTTINGITEKYNVRYDELLDKQDNLIEKMKSAGDLFTISGAGVITVNDLKKQTKQIKDYTKQLAVIKKRVSEELFDEITSYDMKEGSAYISQLLSMSEKDLQAYNEAYSKKMQAANYAGKKIYKKDFEQLTHGYRKDVKEAFKGLDEELEKMGAQAMSGFFRGLTTNTNYMEKEIKVFVRGMIDTFKKELQIKSPSKVMAKIEGFTGAGLVEGLTDKINEVKKAAANLANAVAMPLDSIKSDVSGAIASINGSNGSNVTSNSVINNYNLVQNNTSPKSLSALDTYQARRQQIAMIKAFT